MTFSWRIVQLAMDWAKSQTRQPRIEFYQLDNGDIWCDVYSIDPSVIHSLSGQHWIAKRRLA